MSLQTLPKIAASSKGENDVILKELARICASNSFSRSPGLIALLQFLVTEELAGRGRDLKEVYIGHIHFGRDATYDPKADALVRVNANRLRLRLAALYEDEPAPVVQIVIPRGSYTPTYLWMSPQVERSAQGDTSEHSNNLPLGLGSSPEPDGTLLPPSAPGLESPPGHQDRAWLRLKFLKPSFGFLLLSLTLLALSLFLTRRSGPAEQFVSHPFTRLSGIQSFGAFSPDGQRIAFAWSEAQEPEHTRIFVQDLNSVNPEPLVSGPGQNTRPAWSPDGSQIAFLHLEDGKKEVRLLDLKTHRIRSVTSLRAVFHGCARSLGYRGQRTAVR